MTQFDAKPTIPDLDILILEAIRQTASHIIIEVRPNAAVVRFRVEGDLKEHAQWPVGYAQDVAVLVFQLNAEERAACMEVINTPVVMVDFGEHCVEIRSVPAHPAGFDIAIRLKCID